MAESEAADFWQFSLAVYAAPGVAEECLALQDRHGIDVNIALFCCWYGWSGRGRLAAVEIAAAEARVAEWTRNIVVPLRSVRRALKPLVAPAAAAIRTSVKRLELDAEREEQRLLVAGVPAASDRVDPAGDAALNLTSYLAAHGVADVGVGRLLGALPHT
ncbi:MAG: hypothetical protein JWL84_848 [Rhodospirillales bacterium]|nr:hypothetical protein [Rhodospirillales bacterium]